MSVESALARIRGKLADRVASRTRQGSEIAKELHRTAPRGGVNLNRWGENRSAPGEQPAMEEGTLFALIDQGVTIDRANATGSFVANYVVQEYGYDKDGRRLDPRPMGRLTVTQLKQEVGGGS